MPAVTGATMGEMTPARSSRLHGRLFTAVFVGVAAVGCANPFGAAPTTKTSQPGAPAASPSATVSPTPATAGPSAAPTTPATAAPPATPEEPRVVARKPTEPAQWRGVWLNHDMIAEGPIALTRTLNQFADAGINVIFANTWFRGVLLYPGSAFARQDPRFEGWDPLKTLADETHKRGMKLLPWFEYGFITHYNVTGDPRDVGPVLEAHPDWAATDRAGNVPLLHTDHKVYFYSLSPAVPAARVFLRDLVLETAGHAQVDGIQLDRIRFPYPGTSYDTYSRETFKLMKADPTALPEDDPDWVAWRQDQVTAFMTDLKQQAAKVAPDLPITAAVLPSSANKDHYQNWAEWCAQGNLDVATPLDFNASQEYVEREIEFARQSVSGSRTRLVIGLAAMHAGEVGLASQVKAATGIGAGVALWDDRWVRSNLTIVRAALVD